MYSLNMSFYEITGRIDICEAGNDGRGYMNIFKDTMTEMTYRQIEKLVDQDAIVLFPVGIIEEHGPHLPIGTDIYLAYKQAHDVWEELNVMGIPCVIAPPFYLGGVQALTRHFAGTFAFSRETMVACIGEYLDNLDRFGFKRIVFFNDHGDGLHISAIIEAIRNANRKLKLRSYWMEYDYELEEHGFTGEEDYILKLTTMPFEEMFHVSRMPEDMFDIHAGAFETATMREIAPETVREEALAELKPTCLRGEQIGKWCQGEAADKYLIPNGYAGDPEGSRYIETRLKEADRRIAMDIAAMLGNQK